MDDDEELLEKAKAVAAVEDLTEEDKKFVENVLELLRDEKKVSKKARRVIEELHAEHIKPKDESSSDDDVDEDDFV